MHLPESESLITSVITLWALKHSRKPKDADFPYGRGKLETIASFALGGILVATAGGIGTDQAQSCSRRLLTCTSVALGVGNHCTRACNSHERTHSLT